MSGEYEQLVIDWAYLTPLEQRIKTVESTGLRDRWDFGCYLRDKHPLRQGERTDLTGEPSAIAQIAAEMAVSERELRRRRSFATLYPTEQDFGRACQKFESWTDIVERGLKPPPPEGQYRTITIDPPWPIEKIEREVRPRQHRELDYSTMSLEEIEALPIPDLAADDGCHVYLWVTHRFLPDGLRLLTGWGGRYECSLTWVKPTGMTPYSWMYDTEHALFARIGSLRIEEMGLRLSLEAPVSLHSAKPAAFYERVCRASPGPRLAMFERGQREGFEVWGDEVAAA